jgi:hypothetical protein
MSGRFRYYSVVYRRIIHDGYGPGGKKLQEKESGGGADPRQGDPA